MKEKIITIEEAINKLSPNTCIMLGGFGGVGVPYELIEAIAGASTAKLNGLHIVSNDAGIDGKRGVADLLQVPGLVRKLTTTYVNGNSHLLKIVQSGELELDLTPIGTLYERIRAAGAGLGGVLTPTGIGTKAAEGKRIIDTGYGSYILAEPFKGNAALIRAWKADKAGNLVLRRVQKTYNIAMATAADLVIAEAEEIVDTGDIDPDEISIPSVLVDYIVKVQVADE